MVHLLFGKDSDSFCYRVVWVNLFIIHSTYRAIYAEIVPQQKGDKLCERVYKISFSEKVVTCRQTNRDTPTERTIPIFHPSPFSDGKSNFLLTI